MKATIFACEMATAAAAIVAAWFWFRSAQGEAPPATWDQIDQLKPWLDEVARLNRWAATWTGISAALAALSAFLSGLF